MRIKGRKKITFINDCGVMVSVYELERAMNWYSEKPSAPTKHIYMHGQYPAVSIYREKVHVHRLLMMYWLQISIPSDCFVHHIDGNKLNALRENLCLMPCREHQSKHNKNKKLTENHKRKIGEKNRLRRGIKMKKQRQDITVENVIALRERGNSINKIAKKLNCGWSTVLSRIEEHDDPELMGAEK